MTESDDYMFNTEEPEEEAPEESNNNRTFIIAMGAMGVLVLLSLACIAAYMFYIAPKMEAQKQAVEATTIAQNAVVEAALTGTAAVLAYTPTALPTGIPSNTPVPSPTPMVVKETATVDITATVAYGYTEVAKTTGTVIATSTALAQTGLAEDIGLPGLVTMAIAFVIVIFLARRMRSAPAAR